MEDGNHSRRNLVVTSLCFIIYVLADGSFNSDKGVTLQVINVTFKNHSALIFAAWGVLFWSAFRYGQSNVGNITDGFRKEIADCCPRSLSEWHIKRTIGTTPYNIHVRSLSLENASYWSPIVFNIQQKGNEGQIISGHTNEIASWSSAFVFNVAIRLQLAIVRPTISSYTTPWLLFALAIALGSSELLQPAGSKDQTIASPIAKTNPSLPTVEIKVKSNVIEQKPRVKPTTSSTKESITNLNQNMDTNPDPQQALSISTLRPDVPRDPSGDMSDPRHSKK